MFPSQKRRQLPNHTTKKLKRPNHQIKTTRSMDGSIEQSRASPTTKFKTNKNGPTITLNWVPLSSSIISARDNQVSAHNFLKQHQHTVSHTHTHDRSLCSTFLFHIRTYLIFMLNTYYIDCLWLHLFAWIFFSHPRVILWRLLHI